jgi:RHS repeat-associated protein
VSTSIWFSNPTIASAAVAYDADGNVTSRAWTGTNAKSQVLEWDPFGLRQFDYSEGRFLSADPLGHSGSLSLYEYAYNDPVNWVDADGRFGKGIGVGARDMAVGFWDLFYNVGGSFEYAMTGDDAFAEQWAGLKGVGYGLAQLGSDLWNGNLGDVGRALTGGEGRSGGFRTGYGGFQIATFYLSGAKLGQLGRVGEVAEVGVNVTRAGEAGSALKVATQAFEKGGGWGYPRNALLSPNAEAGGIGAAAKGIGSAKDLGIPESLSQSQQRHLPPVSDGRSVLTADPADLLKGLHNGESTILRQPKPGQVVVDFGKPIGEYWSNGTKVGETRFGSIMYGKKGAHIVPANPTQW